MAKGWARTAHKEREGMWAGRAGLGFPDLSRLCGHTCSHGKETFQFKQEARFASAELSHVSRGPLEWVASGRFSVVLAFVRMADQEDSEWTGGSPSSLCAAGAVESLRTDSRLHRRPQTSSVLCVHLAHPCRTPEEQDESAAIFTGEKEAWHCHRQKKIKTGCLTHDARAASQEIKSSRLQNSRAGLESVQVCVCLR